jgi:hypothetical protein
MRERKPLYSIHRTENFISKTKQLSKVYPRLSEFLNAIDWALMRRPHHFNNIIADFYLWVTAELESDEFPNVKIIYRIDEDNSKVILMEMEES